MKGNELSMGHEGLTCRVEDGVAELILGFEPLNVLDDTSMQALIEALNEIAAIPALRCLVIRSRLKAFSAGVDVPSHRGERARPTLRLFDRLLKAIEAFGAPTVAMVAGAALGGGMELALACDIRVLAHEAKLGVPEIALGVFPPYAVIRLPELIGSGYAAQLILSGNTVDGKTATRLGLAEHGAPRDQLETTLEAVVDELRSKSATSLHLAKEALRLGHQGRELRFAAVEKLYLDRLMTTADADEGLKAFIERRPPVWQHR